MSLSCPRLRPIINNDKINPLDVREKQLCQVLCAYRIFLPFVGITVSSRESASFRNGIVKIAATKVSAGVSTGIGDHEQQVHRKGDGRRGRATSSLRSTTAAAWRKCTRTSRRKGFSPS